MRTNVGMAGSSVQRSCQPGALLDVGEPKYARSTRATSVSRISPRTRGRRGWLARGERARLAQLQRQAAAAADPADRLCALAIDAIKPLLSTWRAWGRVLREAEEQENQLAQR
jgi:hypothetical protein